MTILTVEFSQGGEGTVVVVAPLLLPGFPVRGGGGGEGDGEGV